MNCVHCNNELIGRQRKYCSRLCKNSHNNHQFQSYLSQQKRGRERKLKLIALLGSACKNCGYNKNYAALEFHHRIPDKKEFQLDLRSLSNRKWEVIRRLPENGEHVEKKLFCTDISILFVE